MHDAPESCQKVVRSLSDFGIISWQDLHQWTKKEKLVSTKQHFLICCLLLQKLNGAQMNLRWLIRMVIGIWVDWYVSIHTAIFSGLRYGGMQVDVTVYTPDLLDYYWLAAGSSSQAQPISLTLLGWLASFASMHWSGDLQASSVEICKPANMKFQEWIVRCRQNENIARAMLI
jgi:hypothetical protein